MHSQDHSSTGFPWRRIFAVFSLISVTLYVAFFAAELVHGIRERFVTKPPPEYIDVMQTGVANQLKQIRSANTHLLADTLVTDLSTFDCRWYFVCHPRPTQTVNAFSFVRPCPTCALKLSSTTQAVIPPELTFKVGGAPVPTWHTVFGAPHALRIVAVKILAAGPWAVIMFLACTVLYFGIASIAATRSKDGVHPFIALIIVTCSPLGITLLANIFQWAATRLFLGLSWAVSLFASILVYSAAISLAVSLPHIWKAPREIYESAELIRRA